ncbi:TolB family protein [Streptomyces sp. NPDC058464]|uniref:TolB family protein n=1 Tax=Streptomyces sp. NPDC058464 TaxID=3346511 RepID=UPI0036490DA9
MDIGARALLATALVTAAVTLAGTTATAAPEVPYTERASIAQGDGQLAEASFGAAATDLGVAFTSNGAAYSGDTNGQSDVYYRSSTGTSVVSYAAQAGGGTGDGPSYDPSACSTGRFIAFVSQAANLTTTPRQDHEPLIYLRNRSVGKIGSLPRSYEGVPFTSMGDPAISFDCQWVAFVATLPSTPDHVEQSRVYRYRVYDGSVTPVSQVSEDGSRAAGRPSISADGRYIAYQYAIPHRGGPADHSDIYVRDMDGGTLEKASVARDGGAANRESTGPSISADGRTVAFDSYASNLTRGDTNGSVDVFVRDLDQGRTRLIKGRGRGTFTYGASLSADGLRVAYESGRLADPSAPRQVWLADLPAGRARLVSANLRRGPGDGSSTSPSIRPDGLAVSFESYADDLVPGDTNGAADVFVRHLG